MARSAEELAVDNAAVVARLSAALENPALSDLILLSERDGSETRAAAILLASCSPVFTQMLTGAFAEGAEARGRKRRRDGAGGGAESAPAPPPVRCGFGGEALGAIVAFAATNDAPALWSGSAALMGEVLQAAEYYDIDGLRGKAKRRLAARAEEVPAEACEVLQAVWERWEADEFDGDGCAGEVAEAAMEVIGEMRGVALVGCACLCEEALKKVLERQGKDGAGEAAKFSALQKWLLVNNDEERRAADERLVKCLSLELMPASFVSDVVAKSGLVSNQVLFAVFETLALKAELSCTLEEGALPNWCSSASAEFRFSSSDLDADAVGLLDRSLDSGCWTWEIRADSTGDHQDVFGVGLVTGGVDSNRCLSDQTLGYMYSNYGFCYGASKHVSDGPVFSEGDTIRLTFDCEAGNLTTKVNDEPPHEAFHGIRSPGSRRYFRPAVSLTSGGCATILSFSRVKATV